jgi:hypothetical protein
MSEAKIYPALATFQQKVPKIDLDGEVQTKAYKFKYATLANILDKTKTAMDEAKMGVTQFVAKDVLVTRVFSSEDGSFIESQIPIPVGGDPKNVGGSITYFRRYCLTAMLGIAGEEDKDAPEAAPKKKMTQAMLDKAMERIGEGEPGVAKSAYEHLDCSFEQIKQMIEAGG